jgi:hypothetical protein
VGFESTGHSYFVASKFSNAEHKFSGEALRKTVDLWP